MTISIDNTKWVQKNTAINGGAGASCWMPVFSHPNPNTVEDSTQALRILQREKYTWIVGTSFFDNYFTIFDERPVVEHLGYQNVVGFSPCASNIDHIDITQDTYDDKIIPDLSDSDEGPIDLLDPDAVGDGEPGGKEKAKESGSKAGMVVGIIIVVIVFIGSAAFYLYRRRKANANRTFTSRAHVNTRLN